MENNLKLWLKIDCLPLKKILTPMQYDVITKLHGFKCVERIGLNDLASEMKMSVDMIMNIHTKGILKIMGYCELNY